MAHVEDRWYRTVRLPQGGTQRVKTNRFGKGNRYRVRYIGPDGRERSKSFPDKCKRDAEAFLVSTEADKLRGSYIDPVAGRMKFAEYAEAWLSSRTFDESTRESVQIRLRKHILPYLGNHSLAAIKPGHIREWDRALTAVLAPTTRAVAFAYLRSILSAAVDDERIVKNPCSARSVTPPRPGTRRVVPWTSDVVSAIRSGLAGRYRGMVDVGAGCGLRQGEIFGLEVEDLDLDGGWLYVRRQVKRVYSRLVFGLPKNDLERRVPLPRSVVRTLREHMKRYPPVEISLPWEDPHAEQRVSARLVFTSSRRGAINRSTFAARSWRPALLRAGITPTRATGMHALRHFYASVLLEKGVSIKALAEYLGHADPAFTLRVYTHLMPSSDGRSRSAVDELLDSWDEGAGKPDGLEAA